MVTRRKVLAAGGGATLGTFLFHAPSSAAEPTLAAALERSRLVYISPIRSDGKESRCHSEVLFVADGDDVYICSREAAWRTRAVLDHGLNKARLWVGEVGRWQAGNRDYASLPSMDATVTHISKPEEHARILAMFVQKYPERFNDERNVFRDGLKDGTWVMFRYASAPG